MAYAGLVAEIPLGQEGMTGSKNLAAVKPTQLLRARAITYEDGTLRKEGGDTKYNTTAIDSGASILAGWDWHPTIGTQRMVVVTSTGKVLKDSGDGSFPTTLLTGLSLSSTVPVFVEGGQEAATLDRKLFLFTGRNQVQVLDADGTSMADMSDPPTDWSGTYPKTGLVHEGRLWGFMGHFAYYSTTTDHENFIDSTSGVVPVYPGEGEEIVCAFVFGPYIVCCKQPYGWYLIDTIDPDVTRWKVSRITRHVGVAGPLAYALTDGDAMIVDVSGEVFALSAITEQTDIRPRSVTQEALFSPWIRENTNPAHYGKIVGLSYAAKRQIWLAVAGAGATTNTYRIKADLLAGVLKFGFSDTVVCESLWLRKDSNNIPRPVAGDANGFVRLLDQETRSHDGAGFQGEFQTPHNDLSYVNPELATKRKNGQFLELVFEPKGDWDLSVDIQWDGKLTETIPYSMSGAGSTLGVTTTLDVDFILGGASVKSLRKRITGSGRRFSMTGRNSGAGQDFSIAQAFLHFVPGDER